MVFGLVLFLLAHAIGGTESRDDSNTNTPPIKGDTAKDFTLWSLNREEVSLKSLTAHGPVVLLVLRGYPGYQ
jgi:hypothetical protein